MKANIYSKDGTVVGDIELPQVFSRVPRDDLIQRAHRAISLSLRQPWGTSPTAGLRRVGHTSGPGQGRSRIPRVAERTRAVILASVVGGRSAHAPTTERRLYRKINHKERKMARYSAIASTAIKEKIIARGHRIPEGLEFPVVVDESVAGINRTSDAVEFLKKIGLYDDIIRAKNGTKIRAGRGKMRGRRYKQPKSILIVTTHEKPMRGFRGLPGVDLCTPTSLSIRKLAPGGQGGRLTIYTTDAIGELRKVEAQ